MNYVRKFYEEESRRFYPSLAAARRESKGVVRAPYIYRVWLDRDAKIVGKAPVYCWGSSVGSVRSADRIIEESLRLMESGVL